MILKAILSVPAPLLFLTVGQNTWEVWCLRTGGGWFHPIHIHLVDFYVIARNRDPAQVRSYETFMPKVSGRASPAG